MNTHQFKASFLLKVANPFRRCLQGAPQQIDLHVKLGRCIIPDGPSTCTVEPGQEGDSTSPPPGAFLVRASWGLNPRRLLSGQLSHRKQLSKTLVRLATDRKTQSLMRWLTLLFKLFSAICLTELTRRGQVMEERSTNIMCHHHVKCHKEWMKEFDFVFVTSFSRWQC